MLVTVDNEAGHFFKVMKKMGIPLTQYVESDHLRILDLLSAQKHAEMGHSLAFHFEHLLREIVNQLDPWMKRKQEIVVMIESLSTLYALTEHPEELASFCRYCVNLGSVQGRNPSSFVTLLNGDVDAEAVSLLRPLFDFVVRPVPIDLISIANVDGRIRLDRNRILEKETTEAEISFSTELYYRLRDSGVLFFPHVDLNLWENSYWESLHSCSLHEL